MTARVSISRSFRSGVRPKNWFVPAPLLYVFGRLRLHRGASAYERAHYGAAFQHFRASALLGEKEAQFRLALCYASGRGTIRQSGDAAAWCRKAAERGMSEHSIS